MSAYWNYISAELIITKMFVTHPGYHFLLRNVLSFQQISVISIPSYILGSVQCYNPDNPKYEVHLIKSSLKREIKHWLTVILLKFEMAWDILRVN